MTLQLHIFASQTGITNEAVANIKILKMTKSFLIILTLIFIGENEINAQSKKGKWIQRDITIDWHDSYNFILYSNALVKSFICNEKGNHELLGRFLMINNNSNDTIFYRASPKGLGRYITQKDIEFISTVSNMSQYYPVIPRQSEIVEIHGYETVREKKLMMNLIIDFKFFQPDSASKKTTGITTNNKFPKSNTPPRDSNIITNKDNTQNSFYIFLTVSIEIKPKESQFSNLQSSKSIYCISKPILHKGQLEDDMQIEKELFIADLKKHFSNEPDVIKKIGNKEIGIHYGEPYSTKVSKTIVEGYAAIEAYKNSTKETLEGLAQYEFLEL